MRIQIWQVSLRQHPGDTLKFHGPGCPILDSFEKTCIGNLSQCCHIDISISFQRLFHTGFPSFLTRPRLTFLHLMACKKHSGQQHRRDKSLKDIGSGLKQTLWPIGPFSLMHIACQLIDDAGLKLGREAAHDCICAKTPMFYCNCGSIRNGIFFNVGVQQRPGMGSVSCL